MPPAQYKCQVCGDWKDEDEFVKGRKPGYRCHYCHSLANREKKCRVKPLVPGGFTSIRERKHSGECVAAGIPVSDTPRLFWVRMRSLLAEQLAGIVGTVPDDPLIRIQVAEHLKNFNDEIKNTFERFRSKIKFTVKNGGLGNIEVLTTLEEIRARTILGLPLDKELSADQIKQSQRKLALKNHPDRGGTVALMAEINRAATLLLKGN